MVITYSRPYESVINHYGNISTNYSLDRDKNRSANRYNEALIKRHKDKNRSKREKIMIRDRLHILDRMSTSLNGDNKSESDFSDARSIKNRNRVKIHNPYMIETKPQKNSQMVLNLKDKLSGKNSRNFSDRTAIRSNNAIFITNPASQLKTFGSDEEMPEEFAQYHNIDSTDVDDLDYNSKYITGLPNLSYSGAKIHRNVANYSVGRETKTLSPMEAVSKSVPFMRKNSLKTQKTKNVIRQLKKINENLDPKFKMAKIDLEELQSSQTLQLGEWNREISPELITKLMKEERRREYWKRRIKASNPRSSTSMDS